MKLNAEPKHPLIWALRLILIGLGIYFSKGLTQPELIRGIYLFVGYIAFVKDL